MDEWAETCYFTNAENPCPALPRNRWLSKPGWPEGFWCWRHYRRWLANGDPLGGRTEDGAPRRFLNAVAARPPDTCVDWPYGLSRGRPQVRLDGQQMGAARAALILASGPPAVPSLQAAHAPVVCHNPMCVNPRHLRWATAVENNADKRPDNTWQIGTRNPAAKLTEPDVVFIRSSSESDAVLARRFGVSDVAVSNARRGKTWRHVAHPTKG